MTTFEAPSAPSSVVPSISDLDGFTIGRDYNFPAQTSYAPSPEDDFGFDPPQVKSAYQQSSPPADLSLSGWPEFNREDDAKVVDSLNLDTYDMDKFVVPNLPTTSTAVSRYGQMTPPRSTSAASSDFKEDPLSPKTAAPERRKKSKSQPKELEQTATTTPGRKRKASRKTSIVSSKDGDSPEDQKRKQSLEKNRLAAAKCRMNKKDKTEKLQRDSHDKAVENAYLKDEVMRMKTEIQQINALLIAHANCDGCKSPEEIRAHISDLGNDFFNQHMAFSAHNFGDFSQMNLPDLPPMPDNFFSNGPSNHMMHPPLPDFDRSAEFEVHTPMQTD